MTSSTPSAGKLSTWFIGLFFAIIAFAGFAFASHGGSESNYTLGLIIGFAGIFGIFTLVKRGFDAA